jgi:large subunit ribosomal protein L10
MVRPEKVAVVDEIKERLESADAIFITEYRGLSVAQMQKLRRALRGSEADYKIYKMSLTRLAAEAAGLDGITDWLEGPTAIAFTSGDPVPTAKELQEFADGNENLVLKGGVLSGQLLDVDAIKALAKLEPREVLLAKLAGAISAPMTTLAGLMQAVIRQVATVVQQLAEKGDAGAAAEGPVVEAADEEAAVEETAPAESEAPPEEVSEEPAVAAAAETPTAEEAEEGAEATDEASAPEAAEGAATEEPVAEEAAEPTAEEEVQETETEET